MDVQTCNGAGGVGVLHFLFFSVLFIHIQTSALLGYARVSKKCL